MVLVPHLECTLIHSFIYYQLCRKQGNTLNVTMIKTKAAQLVGTPIKTEQTATDKEQSVTQITIIINEIMNQL